MHKKTIEFGLSRGKIDRAIKEIERYKNEISEKLSLLRLKIAELIRDNATLGFNGAMVDDITSASGGPRFANVDVKLEDSGNVSIIIASGVDAIWVEFGAGVYHNGSIGTSPHPLGEELGYTIGGYGSQGERETWVFKDEVSGEKKFTHGTPASMPMYKAFENAIDNMERIVREIFK